MTEDSRQQNSDSRQDGNTVNCILQQTSNQGVLQAADIATRLQTVREQKPENKSTAELTSLDPAVVSRARF
jgi:hypothetical protein